MSRYRGCPVVASSGEVLVVDVSDRDGGMNDYALTSLDRNSGIEFDAEHIPNMVTALEHAEINAEGED